MSLILALVFLLVFGLVVPSLYAILLWRHTTFKYAID